MKNYSDILVLAGGEGARLWPASSADCPKQFLPFIGGESFLRATLQRALALEFTGKIFVVTRAAWIDMTLAELRRLPEEARGRVAVIGEPFGRNTAPAAALVSRVLCARGAEANMLMLPSDHIIKDTAAFARDMKTAASLSAEGAIVIFGIRPASPETGYGYIEAAAPLEAGVFPVRAFHEKPDRETAERYLGGEGHFWNAGIYAFRPAVFLAELERCAPEVARAFGTETAFFTSEERDRISVFTPTAALLRAYENAPALSIDKAVSERSAKCVMVEASFDWDDAGNWDALSRYTEAARSDTVELSARGNFVYADIPVALCGVDNLVVVIKNGRALVMKKGCGNMVRGCASLPTN